MTEIGFIEPKYFVNLEDLCIKWSFIKRIDLSSFKKLPYIIGDKKLEKRVKTLSVVKRYFDK